MPTKAQKIRLTIFIFLSLIALLILIGVLTSQRFLEKRDTYYIAFEDVSVGGLEIGSPVKYLGIKVGVVDDIRIDPKDVARVIITVELKAGTPVKTDARADINTVGITGLKTIEIRGGSNQAELLKPGNYIQPGYSLTEEITDRADVISRRLEIILNNLQTFTAPENMNKFTNLAQSAGEAFEKTNAFLDENRRSLSYSIEKTRKIAAELDTSSVLLRKTLEDINRIVGSDTLGQIIENTRAISMKLKEADLIALIGELREVADRTNHVLLLLDTGLERGGQDFITSMRKLKATSEYLEEFSRTLQQDPSVLLRGAKIENMPDKNLD
jgi:phospholipid/cholesterol/gamma-HCH transport system substrate-binding protein